jgi:alpha-mannosidase
MGKGRLMRVTILWIFCHLITLHSFSQKVYFIDGYHGGVYGHYPKQYTGYINESLAKNPAWNINLEIEPETWDTVKMNEPGNYIAFKNMLADQSMNARMEYVNPAYGQGYMYNINGESIIRQFHYGIKKLKEHFPGIIFTTYSSEEPCFTSALPQILTSFGFKYASLKNPNTCWGGYTRAFGGEVINWVGPDGTKIITSPRYAVEALDSHSTWQTTASNNSAVYLDAAFKAGIKHPVGMCLQDAGWKNGPWLGDKPTVYQTDYTTWRNYFETASTQPPTQDWNFSQEDVQVSLVWGAQVLQKIAKQVRISENKIIEAEVLYTMASLYKGANWPVVNFDEAWRGLLLAQHHDCWIVPYNGSKGNTWIDKVKTWTSSADRIADSAINFSKSSLSEAMSANGNYYVRVFNTLANSRNSWIKIELPEGFNAATIRDGNGNEIPSQTINGEKKASLIFKAAIPSVGYNTYKIEKTEPASKQFSSIQVLKSGIYKFENELYKILIDPSQGGVIKSLVAKKLSNKEFVDKTNPRGFNELRGFFYKDNSFFSSRQNPAEVTIKENGAGYSCVEIKGTIHQQPFTQTISLSKDGPVINIKLKIDWTGNEGIGDGYKQSDRYNEKDYRKAFYNDSDKLQTLFPLNLAGQKVYKNAPFDVTESRLDNTFFQTWDSIKNNIILNWVDVTDKAGKYGLALFSDHTTSYAHGKNFPLGLTTQYSGIGLWGRTYSITGPTEFNYAILPHNGKWSDADVWARNTEWNVPVQSTIFKSSDSAVKYKKSLINFSGKGIEITALMMEGNDLLVRLFNGSGAAINQQVYFDGNAETIHLEELNGVLKQPLAKMTKGGGITVNVTMPKFGIRTIRLTKFKATTIKERPTTISAR